MSEESVEFVRRATEALEPRGIQPDDPVLEEFFDPSIEWRAVREGRIVRWEGFTSRRAAFEAAGVPE